MIDSNNDDAARVSAKGRASKLRELLDRVTWPVALELTLVALALGTHVYALPKMPQGFYKDEVSIVYNAYLIATTGYDEFGEWFPMYTKSWGDYKNAGYVYLCVLVTRLFGLSAWTVRLTSVFCWIVGTWALYSLGRTRWPRAPARLFLLLLAAFTPSLFCLSRMAFEVIGLYPALALFLLGMQRGFEAGSVRWAAVAGVAMGACTYMYSTFRLLAPLHCVLVLLCYGTRRHLRSLLSFATAAAVSVIPFAWYMYAHGENLTARYREIGYVHRDIPAATKAAMFVARYVNHFGQDYLLFHGDTNLRLHTGFFGELFGPSWAMLLVAIALIAGRPELRRVRFHWLLLGGLVLSPVAAALTNEPHNSLRAFSLVVFSIPLAVLGFHQLLPFARRWLPVTVLVATLLCAGAFVAHYFGPYRSMSIAPFEYYGIEEAIEKAARAEPSRIVIDNRRRGLHADLYANFYTVILKKRWGDRLPPLEPGRPEHVKPGELFIYQDRKYAYPQWREGLPQESLFLAVPHGPRLRQLARRKKR